MDLMTSAVFGASLGEPDQVCRNILALVNASSNSTSISEFIEIVGEALSDTGFKVDRLFLSLQTLHPAVRAKTYLCLRSAQEVETRDWPHGLAQRPGYFDSPDHHVHSTGLELRVPKLAAQMDRSCGLYRELAQAGFTDYVIFPLRFGDSTINTLSVATREPDGFDGEVVSSIRALVPLLSIMVERFAALETIDTALDTYVGRNARNHVRLGAIRPGSGELLEAAILFADLHDFTAHASNLGPTGTVQLLNQYFDCMVDPIEENGGYVLKFIGDAVLAIFPRVADEPEPGDLAAALAQIAERFRHLNRVRESKGLVPLRQAMSVHYGEVLYGNIGSSSRLDFTVIGEAVNVAARCLEITSSLGVDEIYTSGFVAAYKLREIQSLGEHQLRGAQTPIELFAPAAGDPALPGKRPCNQLV